MFAADIPYVPLQDAPVVLLAQAKPSKNRNEVILTGCQDVDSTFENSAFNSLGVLGGEVFRRLGYPWSSAEQMYVVPPKALAGMKVTILQSPQHGTVERAAPNLGWWQYKPVPGYVGKDKVSFLVEAEGRCFKITWNLLVHEVVDENANPPECEKVFREDVAPKKINFFWVPDPSASFGAVSLSSHISDTGGITLSFDKLSGGALGQTTGESKGPGSNCFSNRTEGGSQDSRLAAGETR